MTAITSFGMTSTIKVRCPACKQVFGMDVKTYDEARDIGCPTCKCLCHKDHYRWWVTLTGQGDIDVESLRTLLIGG